MSEREKCPACGTRLTHYSDKFDHCESHGFIPIHGESPNEGGGDVHDGRYARRKTHGPIPPDATEPPGDVSPGGLIGSDERNGANIWRFLGTEDEANPHLITAGKNATGWVYPFLNVDVYADEDEGQLILNMATRIRELEAEVERCAIALRLGGHLRPDGTACDYIATGTVCNKCGATDPAFGMVGKLKARLATAVEALEEINKVVDSDGAIRLPGTALQLVEHCATAALNAIKGA